VLYILAPVVLVAIGSFGEKWFGTILPEGFTFDWYVKIFSTGMFTNAIRISIIVAALAVVCTALLSLPAAYAVHMSGNALLRRLFSLTVVLPIAVPPIVIALGLIQAYNWPWLSLVGTWQLLLAAHVVWTLPFMARPVLANLDRIGWQQLNEAANSLGAGGWYITRKVLIPNMSPGLLAGGLMVSTMSLGEFQLARLLTSSSSHTFPVVLYQAFYVSTGMATAATTILIAIAFISTFGLVLLSRFLGGLPEATVVEGR
jgi:putative spermidine/putrescine transport system permease protein